MGDIIIAIVGFAVSMVALVTPIVKLNGTIAKLNTTVTILNKTISTNEEANRAEHQELFERIEALEKENTELKTKVGIYHS